MRAVVTFSYALLEGKTGKYSDLVVPKNYKEETMHVHILPGVGSDNIFENISNENIFENPSSGNIFDNLFSEDISEKIQSKNIFKNIFGEKIFKIISSMNIFIENIFNATLRMV